MTDPTSRQRAPALLGTPLRVRLEAAGVAAIRRAAVYRYGWGGSPSVAYEKPPVGELRNRA